MLLILQLRNKWTIAKIYRNKKFGFVVATHRSTENLWKFVMSRTGTQWGTSRAAFRYSVASQTFATTPVITDVTALVVQGSSSAKFVGSGGTNSRSHVVRSGELGGQKHQLSSSLVACPTRLCGRGLFWCSRNVRKKWESAASCWNVTSLEEKRNKRP